MIPDTETRPALLPSNLLHLRQLVRSLWQVRSESLFQRLWPTIRKVALGIGFLSVVLSLIPFLFFVVPPAAVGLARWKNWFFLLLGLVPQALAMAWAVRWAYGRLWSRDEEVRLLPFAPETRLRILLGLLLRGILVAMVLRVALIWPVKVAHNYSFMASEAGPLAAVTVTASTDLARAFAGLVAALAIAIVWLLVAMTLLAQLRREASSFARQVLTAFLIAALFHLLWKGAEIAMDLLLSRLSLQGLFPRNFLKVGFTPSDALAYGLVIALHQLPPKLCSLAITVVPAVIFWPRLLPKAREAFLTPEHPE